MEKITIKYCLQSKFLDKFNSIPENLKWTNFIYRLHNQEQQSSIVQ